VGCENKKYACNEFLSQKICIFEYFVVTLQPKRMIIMKKMYNKPQTEVTPVNTEYLMQTSLVVSDGGNSSQSQTPISGD
jgi:hypothetical protein